MRLLRRWLMLCPERRDQKRRPLEPSEFEINSIRNDKQKLATVRSRCQMHEFTVSRIHCLTNSPTHETTSTTVSPDGLRREHRVPDTALNCQSGPDQSEFVRVQKS